MFARSDETHEVLDKFAFHYRHSARLETTDAGLHPCNVAFDVVNGHLLKLGKRLGFLAAVDTTSAPREHPRPDEQQKARSECTNDKTISLS